MSVIKSKLSKLVSTMDELQNRAFQYKTFQKNFKIEITKYEELEQVHAELRLKELLWRSLDEWDTLLVDWYDMEFHSIDPEDMNNTVSKYAKYAHQLDKGMGFFLKTFGQF
jgi:dynein heavy chain